LPDFAQAVDAGDGAAGFAAFASHAVNELWDDVVEFAFGCELINLNLDFWSFIILDRQTHIPLFLPVSICCVA